MFIFIYLLQASSSDSSWAIRWGKRFIRNLCCFIFIFVCFAWKEITDLPSQRFRDVFFFAKSLKVLACLQTPGHSPRRHLPERGQLPVLAKQMERPPIFHLNADKERLHVRSVWSPHRVNRQKISPPLIRCEPCLHFAVQDISESFSLDYVIVFIEDITDERLDFFSFFNHVVFGLTCNLNYIIAHSPRWDKICLL